MAEALGGAVAAVLGRVTGVSWTAKRSEHEWATATGWRSACMSATTSVGQSGHASGEGWERAFRRGMHSASALLARPWVLQIV